MEERSGRMVERLDGVLWGLVAEPRGKNEVSKLQLLIVLRVDGNESFVEVVIRLFMLPGTFEAVVEGRVVFWAEGGGITEKREGVGLVFCAELVFCDCWV